MQFLKTTFSRFSEDRCTTLAAALAYYTIFALPPLLYLLLMIITAGMSVAYESSEAEGRAESLIEQHAAQLLGNETASDQIGKILEQDRKTGGKWWKSLLSLVGVVIGATGVVAALQDSLNFVWQVAPDPQRGGFRSFFRKRLLSFAMILGLGFLLLASLIVSTVLGAAGSRVGSVLGMQESAVAGLNYLILFLVTSIAFAAIFKFMPDAKIAWRDVWVGALATAVLFMIGRFVLQVYLSRNEPAAGLGSAAASLAVIMVWVYYSSMILLYGAEVTQVYANRYGKGVEPEEGAVKVTRQMKSSAAAST